MTRAPKRAPLSRASPGGPGAMASLRRAQAKLKEMGIKLYRAEPAGSPAKSAKEVKGAKTASEVALPAAPAKAETVKPAAPKRVAPRRAPAAAKRAAPPRPAKRAKPRR